MIRKKKFSSTRLNSRAKNLGAWDLGCRFQWGWSQQLSALRGGGGPRLWSENLRAVSQDFSLCIVCILCQTNLEQPWWFEKTKFSSTRLNSRAKNLGAWDLGCGFKLGWSQQLWALRGGGGRRLWSENLRAVGQDFSLCILCQTNLEQPWWFEKKKFSSTRLNSRAKNLGASDLGCRFKRGWNQKLSALRGGGGCRLWSENLRAVGQDFSFCILCILCQTNLEQPWWFEKKKFSSTRLNSRAKNLGPGILVVDSNWVEVSSCEHSGVELGQDFGVKTLGPWVKTFPCVSCVKQV